MPKRSSTACGCISSRTARSSALADLRGAYGRFQTQLSADEAVQRLLAAISDERLPQTLPLAILPLLTDLFIAAPSPPRLSRDTAQRLADVVASCISGIRQQKPAGSVAGTCRGRSAIERRVSADRGTFAIDSVATSEDLPVLVECPGARSRAGSTRVDPGRGSPFADRGEAAAGKPPSGQ